MTWIRAIVGLAVICVGQSSRSAQADPPSSKTQAQEAAAARKTQRVKVLPPKTFDLRALKKKLRPAGTNDRKPQTLEERRTQERRLASIRAQRDLGNRQVPSAYYNELYRYAKRVADIERVIEVATRSGDQPTAMRATKLLSQERKRHQQWLGRFVKKIKQPHAAPKGVEQ